MRSLTRPFALLLLALLPVLFLWKGTLAGRRLVGLDPFNFFYPYHDAVAAALAAGRLPAWNPWLFGGVPFLADSQAQLFYPLAWPFLQLDAPTALTWSVALHLALAALGAWAWARHLGLGAAGAWGAGALFALGGYLGAQVEHPNQVQAAAWLPWLLLGYGWASRQDASARRRAAGSVLGPLALAMSLLAGHAQTTFISLTLLTLWALRGTVLAAQPTHQGLRAAQAGGLSPPVRRAAGWDIVRAPLVPLLAIVLIGGLLAAVQLAPTQALSALSPRADGLSFREAAAFSLDPRAVPRAFLPTFGRDDPLLSEYVAWIGFSGLVLAGQGVLRGHALRAARDFGLLAGGTGLFLALGGYNPVFWLLWRFVPGFDLFRAPARWLLLWALGAAVLAGVGVEQVGRFSIRPGGAPDFRLSISRRVAGASLALAAVVGIALLVLGDWPRLAVLPWWLGAAALVGLGFWLAGRWRRGGTLLVVALLVAELGAASWGLDYQGATAPEAYSGLRPVPAHLITQQPAVGAARLLSLSDLTWDPGDLATLQARHAGLLGDEAIYDLVVATKLKEVLAPNQPMRWGLQTADGYGGGLLPSARWVAFQRLLPLAKVVPDGRLREQLAGIPRPALLDVMGIQWLVADKVDDWWSANVFHDLGAPVHLAADETVQWEVDPWAVTALSLVVLGDWPAKPGTAVLDERAVALAGAVQVATRQTARGTERHLLLPVMPPARLDTLEIKAASPWVLGGLSLVDERLPAFEPLPADPTLDTTFSGDVKVYRRTEAPGRAWVVPRARAVSTPDEALARLAAPAFDPRAEVVVEQVSATPLPEGGTGEVRWQRDAPEELTLAVSVPEGGWLVLADAPFPGWRATVDGQPTPWLAANGINRALWLPPGEHEVLWRYQTPGLLLGAAGSALGVAALLAWVAWWGKDEG